jgi:hypothetical protein
MSSDIRALPETESFPTATVSVGKFEVRIGDQFVEDAEQFPHNGSDGDFERFSPLHEALKKSFEDWVEPNTAQ